MLPNRKFRSLKNSMPVRIQSGTPLPGLSGNLWLCHLRRCPDAERRCEAARRRGALRSHPPASLTAVCRTMWSPRCSRQNNPHSCTDESVHLAPTHTHTKPTQPRRHRDRHREAAVVLSLLWHSQQIRQAEIPWHFSRLPLRNRRGRGGAQVPVTWPRPGGETGSE